MLHDRSAVKESAIRAAIAHIPTNPRAFDALIIRVDIRDQCYTTLLAVAEEDASRRHALVRFLLHLIIGLAPSDSVLSQIIAFCERRILDDAGQFPSHHQQQQQQHQTLLQQPHVATSQIDMYRELERTARTLLEQQPLRLLSTLARSAAISGVAGGLGGMQQQFHMVGHHLHAGYLHGDVGGLGGEAVPGAPPPYTSHPLFQPLLSNTLTQQQQQQQPQGGIAVNPTRNKRTIALCVADAKECAFIADEKNVEARRRQREEGYPLQLLACKDYIDQTPLGISAEMLQAQLRVLQSYADNYRANPEVLRATSIVVKLILDAWVAKMALGCDLAFLREASIAFVPSMLRLLQGEYMCVQKHVYDLLLNISVHAQLVDTIGAVAGFAAAVETEIVWMTCVVVQRQVLLGSAVGDQLWFAALKASLAIIPRPMLKYLGPRALMRFMGLPALHVCHPHIFDVCAEALAASLMVLRPVVKATPAGGSKQQQQQHQNGVGGSGSGAPQSSWQQQHQQHGHHHHHNQPSGGGGLGGAGANVTSTASPLQATSSPESAATSCFHLRSIAPIAEELLAKIGGTNEVVRLLCLATTSSARLHLFAILFSSAGVSLLQARNKRVPSGGAAPQTQLSPPSGSSSGGLQGTNAAAGAAGATASSTSIASNVTTTAAGGATANPLAEWPVIDRAFAIAAAAGLHWDIHAAARYMPHSAGRDIAQQFIMHFESEARDAKPLLMQAITQVFVVVHGSQKLPDEYLLLIQNVMGSSNSNSSNSGGSGNVAGGGSSSSGGGTTGGGGSNASAAINAHSSFLGASVLHTGGGGVPPLSLLPPHHHHHNNGHHHSSGLLQPHHAPTPSVLSYRMSFAKQCVAVIPGMLRDADEHVRQVGINFAFHLLRFFKVDSHLIANAGGGAGGNSNATTSVTGADLVLAIAKNDSDRVRAGAIDVLAGLASLSRTQPAQVLETFGALLKVLLDTERRTPNLMALYHVILHAIGGRATPSVPEGHDATMMAVNGHLAISQASAEIIGTTALWKLYWALRHDTLHVVCRARFVLVSILSAMAYIGPPTAQIALWKKVTEDISPAVAGVGAQNVLRISGITHYDKYEAAINEALQGEANSRSTHSYVMANKIWQRVESEMR